MASESQVDQIDRQLSARSSEGHEPIIQRTNSYETRDKTAEIADKIFLELDQNRDGCITLEEFRDGALKNPLVITLLECVTHP